MIFGCIDVNYFVIIKEYISMNTYKWQSIKEALPPSYSENLFLVVVKQNSLFSLAGFSFTNIHDSQDSRGRGRLSLYDLSLFGYCHDIYFQLWRGYLQDVWELYLSLQFSRLLHLFQNLLGNTRATMEILQKCLGTFW